MIKKLNIDPNLLMAYAAFNDGDHFNLSQLKCQLRHAENDEGYRCEGFELWFYGQSEDEAHYQKITGHSSASAPFSTIYFKQALSAGKEDIQASEMIRKEVKEYLNNKENSFKYFASLCSKAGI